MGAEFESFLESEVAWGFIGVLVGALVSLVTSYMATIRAIKLQNNEEKFKLRLEYREFQKESLIKIQDLLIDLARIVHLAYMERIHKLSSADTFYTMISDELNQSMMETTRELTKYHERILNDELREQIVQMKIRLNAIPENPKRDKQFPEIFTNLMDNIGFELRQMIRIDNLTK